MAALALTVTAGVVALILAASWPPATGGYDFFAYPSAMFFNRAILEHFGHGRLPLSARGRGGDLPGGGRARVVCGAPQRESLARAAAIGLGAAILGLCLVQLLYNDNASSQPSPARRGRTPQQRSWVDEHVPAGAQVGALSELDGRTAGLHPDLARCRVLEHVDHEGRLLRRARRPPPAARQRSDHRSRSTPAAAGSRRRRTRAWGPRGPSRAIWSCPGRGRTSSRSKAR